MGSEIEIGELAGALSLGPRELVSIVGGGGKTTTLFALADALGPRVVMTTTTKMGSDRTEGHPVLVGPSDPELEAALAEHRRVLVWRTRGGHRADGVDPSDCDRWFDESIAEHVIVEADGSRRRPFKAPYPYEPVVPESTTVLLACIGADAFGQPIGEGCQRPDAVAAIVGADVDAPLTPAMAAAVLLSDDGSRRGLPEGARFVVIAHQVREHHHDAIEALRHALDDRAPMIAVAATS